MKLIILSSFLGFAWQAQAQNKPYYPKGDAAFVADVNDMIQKNVSPSAHVSDYTCTISFDVRTDSTISNVQVIQGVSAEVDNQLKRVVSKLHYIPAIHNGAPMKMNIMKTLTLKL